MVRGIPGVTQSSSSGSADPQLLAPRDLLNIIELMRVAHRTYDSLWSLPIQNVSSFHRWLRCLMRQKVAERRDGCLAEPLPDELIYCEVPLVS